jgi:hypothetical protein
MNSRDFTAPYVYTEYPKWVTLPDGSAILAKNAREEAVLNGQPADPNDDDEVDDETLTDAERKALLDEARSLGLKVHPATGEEKLREKIAAARA